VLPAESASDTFEALPLTLTTTRCPAGVGALSVVATLVDEPLLGVLFDWIWDQAISYCSL
jgi:hypothetical protein